jgi:uncharacterized membrane protein YbaN (DUF454 family)
MIILRPCPRRRRAGWIIVGLGVAGGAIPILPGWPAMILGAFILREQHVWAARMTQKVRARWPDRLAQAEAAEARTLEKFDRWLGRRRA